MRPFRLKTLFFAVPGCSRRVFKRFLAVFDGMTRLGIFKVQVPTPKTERAVLDGEGARTFFGSLRFGGSLALEVWRLGPCCAPYSIESNEDLSNNSGAPCASRSLLP